MRAFFLPALIAVLASSTVALAVEHGEPPSDKPAAGAATLESLVARGAKSNPAAAAPATAHAVTAGVAPFDALTRLSAGNARFVTGQRTRSANVSDDAGERAVTAKGQHPFAAILTCADSRVPPELIFDQSFGDLFVVRNAGNLADPVSEGSLEYAIEHLGVRLVVVLGHASCGAVKAVSGTDSQLPGHLADLQRCMPGLRSFAQERVKAGRTPDGVMTDAVEHNAVEQAATLVAGSEALRHAIASGGLTVLPAVYDLETGVVGFLPQTPASR